MFTIQDGRSHFYQWDIDRKLIVSDPSITQVHFCNRTDECSLVVEVKEGIVDVPNILLQEDWKINVYAYDSKYTKHSQTFSVVKRTKPSDYIYTETEVKSYEDFEDRLKEAEEDIATAANDMQTLANAIGSKADKEEWIDIADITTTEEISYIYYDLPCECKEVVAKLISPSTLTGGFWCSTTEQFWYGTATGVNLVTWQEIKELMVRYKVNKGRYTEIEYIQNTGIDGGEQYFCAEPYHRNILFRQDKYHKNMNGFRIGTTFDDVSPSVFPIGTQIKIWGLKA